MIALLFFLAACNPKEVYSEFHSIPDTVWKKDNPGIFEVDIKNAAVAYDLFIEVRNNDDYPFQNLWLFIESPEGSKDTINVELADIYGKWHGKGLSLYTLSVPYKENYHYPDTGTYTYRIQQGMRQESLQGISDIGLTVSSK